MLCVSIRRASLCLVLSGGGARALAHIGAIQALEEAGMEIDAVAGTSMGALIGALVAKNVKARRIDRMRCYLIDNNPVREYTLPFVSRSYAAASLLVCFRTPVST